jgi:hypothetical protein
MTRGEVQVRRGDVADEWSCETRRVLSAEGGGFSQRTVFFPGRFETMIP